MRFKGGMKLYETGRLWLYLEEGRKIEAEKVEKDFYFGGI